MDVPFTGQSRINLLHFSKTPLAGAPIRLVQALQRHTDYNVRIVDLNRWGLFDHDVIHAENPDEVLDLAEKADIIHLHNYLGFQSKDFYPVNFDFLRRQGKLFLRHFHSTPLLVARGMGIGVSDLLASPMPSVVIAQFQERFYPKARVVPNIIPQDDPVYRPSAGDSLWGIFFSPSLSLGAWGDRWNTKGTPETQRLLEQVALRTGCTVKCVSGRQLLEVLQEKRQAGIVIDDLVTGSYHMSGLEGLSVGKPTLAFLDNRTQRVLSEISGSPACPFVNVRLEDAFEVLVYLLEHPDEMADIGKASREWIERYWSDRILVQHFVDVYEKLITDPSLVVRQESLSLDDKAVRFHAVILPDLVYTSRANRYQDSLPFRVKMLKRIKKWVSLVKARKDRYLPGFLIGLLRYAWRFTRKLVASRQGREISR